MSMLFSDDYITDPSLSVMAAMREKIDKFCNSKIFCTFPDGTATIDEDGTLIIQKIQMPEIEKVIFNEPATIIKWKDGRKTVVKCGDGEIWDPEKGLAMAICKRLMGNKGNYNNFFKKWLDGRHCMTKTDIILEYQAEKAKRAEERRNGAKG